VSNFAQAVLHVGFLSQIPLADMTFPFTRLPPELTLKVRVT